MTGEYERWLKTRPECVQALAAEFPPMMGVAGPDGEVLMVIGWTEDDKLIVSPINPGEDYEGSRAARKYVCAAHLRGNGTCG